MGIIRALKRLGWALSLQKGLDQDLVVIKKRGGFSTLKEVKMALPQAGGIFPTYEGGWKVYFPEGSVIHRLDYDPVTGYSSGVVAVE